MRPLGGAHIPKIQIDNNMTVNKLFHVPLRLLCVLMLALSVTGCIKEDSDDCPVNHTFTVRAYDHAGTELGRDEVGDVSLYVFDGDLCFVERIDTHVGQNVTLQAPAGGDIHLVGWGNLGGGSQSCTQPNVGDPKDACFVSLLPHTRAGGHCLSPDDLFRGEITLTPQEQSGAKEMPIYRETGSMTITIRNLQSYAGFSDTDYSVVVRETHSALDFYGQRSGDKTAYRPAGSFVTTGGPQEYFVPSFNMIPENTGIYIDIYHGTQLIATVAADKAGNAITVEKGKLTNVLIDFRALISVSVALTDWGKYQLWKEF